MIDKKHSIKKTDLSVFKNNGSGIPVEIRSFFDIQDFQEKDDRSIIIAFEGIAYPARLVRKGGKGKQTQISWNMSLAAALNKCYPNILENKNYPDLHIFKINN